MQISATPSCLMVLEKAASLVDIFFIGEARKNTKTLHVVSCIVANAFGSVPHHAISRALDHYQVPERVCVLLVQYYNTLFCRVSTKSYTPTLQRLEWGIMMVCSVSPIFN